MKKMNLKLKKGALTSTVKRMFGKAGFLNGKIKKSVLDELAKLKTITGKRARLARSMLKWHH
jgi:hypothetical protein